MSHVTDAPPLPFLPTGYPLLVIRLGAMPSYNDLLYLAPKARAAALKDERLHGASIAAQILQERRVPLVADNKRIRGYTIVRAKTPYFTCPLFCYVEIKRRQSAKAPEQGERVRDIYNLSLKAFLDGCTDAGLWIDDSERHHTDFWVHYAGTAPKDACEIRFYESYQP